jgi:hypothetical protein
MPLSVGRKALSGAISLCVKLSGCVGKATTAAGPWAGVAPRLWLALRGGKGRIVVIGRLVAFR